LPIRNAGIAQECFSAKLAQKVVHCRSRECGPSVAATYYFPKLAGASIFFGSASFPRSARSVCARCWRRQLSIDELPEDPPPCLAGTLRSAGDGNFPASVRCRAGPLGGRTKRDQCVLRSFAPPSVRGNFVRTLARSHFAS